MDVLLEVIRQTAVSSETMLLLFSASDVVASTDAVLVMVPACVGLTTISTVAVIPSPIVPSWQVTTFPDGGSQVPWLGVAETKVTLEGSVSVTTTPADATGPLFVTVIL